MYFDIDMLSAGKSEDLRTSGEKKKASLGLYTEDISEIRHVDGDTFVDGSGEKYRFNRINTFESSPESFGNISPLSQAMQVNEAANVLGRDSSEITVDDIVRLGLIGKDAFSKIANGTIKGVKSGKDKYGRTLVDLFDQEGNSLQGEDYLGAAGIDASVNNRKAKKERLVEKLINQKRGPGGAVETTDEPSGYGKSGEPELQQRSDGYFNYGSLKRIDKETFSRLGKYEDERYSDAIESTWASNLPGALRGVGNIAARTATGIGTVGEQFEKDYVERLKYVAGDTLEEKSEIWNMTEARKFVDLDRGGYDQKTEISKDDVKAYKEGKPLPAFKQEALKVMEGEIGQREVDLKRIEKQSAKDRKRVSRIEDYRSSDEFRANAEESAIGIIGAILKSPANATNYASQFFESLGQMAMYTNVVTAAPMLAVATRDTTKENTEGFVKEHDREPNENERKFIAAMSFVGEAIDGAVAFKLLKGDSKNFMADAFRKLGSKAPATIQAMPGFVKSMGTEFVQESATAITGEAAKKQKRIGEYDVIDIAESGVKGAFGAGPISVVTGGRNSIDGQHDKLDKLVNKYQKLDISSSDKIATGNRLNNIKVGLEQAIDSDIDVEKKVELQKLLDKIPTDIPVTKKPVEKDTTKYTVTPQFKKDMDTDQDAPAMEHIGKSVEVLKGEWSVEEKAQAVTDLIYTIDNLDQKEDKEAIAKLVSENGAEIVEAVGQLKEKADQLKEEDLVLYSLGEDVYSKETLDSIAESETVSQEAKTAIAEVREIESKDSGQVHKDVVKGKDGYTGFRTYFSQAKKGNLDQKKMDTFVAHMVRKANRFKEGLDLSKENGGKGYYLEKGLKSGQLLKEIPAGKEGDYFYIKEGVSEHLYGVIRSEARLGTALSVLAQEANKKGAETVNLDKTIGRAEELQIKASKTFDVQGEQIGEVKEEKVEREAETVKEEAGVEGSETDGLVEDIIKTEEDVQAQADVRKRKVDFDKLKKSKKEEGKPAGKERLEEDIPLPGDTVQVDKETGTVFSKTLKGLVARFGDELIETKEGESIGDLLEDTIGAKRDTLVGSITTENFDGQDIVEAGEKILGERPTVLKELGQLFDQMKESFATVNSNPELFKLAPNVGALYVDGKLPDQVLYAMTVAASNWMTANSKATLSNNRHVIGNYLYSEWDADLSAKEYQAMATIGLPLNTASQQAGKDALKTLGIRFKGDSSGQVARQEELEASLGLMMFDILSRVEVDGERIVDTPVEQLDLGPYNKNRTINPVGKTGKAPLRVVKVKEKDGKLDRKVIRLLKAFNGSEKIFEELNGVQVDKQNIYTEGAPEDVQDRARGSLSKLPGKVIKLLSKMQNTVWKPIEKNLEIYHKLSADTLNVLGGHVDPDTSHVELRDGIESKNRNIEKDLGLVGDLTGLKKFWFKYKTMSQHRMFIDSNGINPLRSKIHRFLISPGEKFETEIDPKNAEQLITFKAAINQAFDKGFDKESLTGVDTAFDEIVEDPKVQAAVDAIDGKGDIDKAIQELGGNFHQLAGLIALAAYGDGSKKFTTSLGIETDAVTSGYAIGLMQFIGATKEKFLRVGISLDQKVNEYREGLDSKLPDTYTFISSIVKQEIGTGKFQDALKRVHGEISRGLAKPAFMIRNYEAGLDKSVEGVTNDLIEKIYEKLADLQNRYTAAKGNKFDQAEIIKEKNAYAKDLSELVDVEIRLEGDLKKFSLGENKQKIIENVTTHYKPAFDTAFKELIGEVKERKNAVSQVVEGMYFIFKNRYDKDIAKKEKEVGHLLNRNEKRDIANELIDTHYPLIRTFGGDGTFVDLVAVGRTGDARRVENQINPDYIEAKSMFDGTDSEFDSLARDVKTSIKSKKKKTDKSSAAISVVSNYYNGNKGKPFIKKLSDSIAFEPKSSSISIQNLDFDKPGASALVRLIQNIDSIVLGEVMMDYDALSLYDAGYYSLDNVVNATADYNKQFLKVNKEHRIVDTVLDRFRKMYEGISKEERDQVNQLLKKEGFTKESLIARGIKLGDTAKIIAEEFTVIEQLKEEHFDQAYFILKREEKIQEATGEILYSLGETKADIKADLILDQKIGTTVEADLDTVNGQMKGLDSERSSESDVDHSERLDSLLDSTVKPLLKKIGKLTLTLNQTEKLANGWFKRKENSITVNYNRKSPETYSEQSNQEVYLHELVHAVVSRTLDSNARYREKVGKIYSEVKKDLDKKHNGKGWKAFIDHEATPSRAEVTVAKAQYKAAFSGDLQEFLAYGLSNKALSQKLSEMDASKVKWFAGDTWYEKLLNVMVEGIEWLGKKVDSKQKSPSLYFELLDLTQDVTGVNNSRTSQIARWSGKVTDATQLDQWLKEKGVSVRDLYSAKVIEAALKIMGRLPKNKYILPAHVILEITAAAFTKGKTWNQKVAGVEKIVSIPSKMRVMIDNKILNALYGEWHRMVYKMPMELAKLVTKSHDLIERNRKQTKEIAVKQLKSAFGRKVESFESIALTNVLGRTEAFVLAEKYSVEKIIELVGDQAMLQGLIQKEMTQLGIKEGDYWYDQIMGQAERRINETYRSMVAQNINAADKNADRSIDLDRARRLVALVTIGMASKKNRSVVSATGKEELGRGEEWNGISATLVMLASADLEAKKAFVGQELLMTNGYISQISNPHRDLVDGPVDADTQKLMEQRGYRLVETFPLKKGETVRFGLYYAKNIPLDTQTKGAFSMKAKKHRGTGKKAILARRYDQKIEKIMAQVKSKQREETLIRLRKERVKFEKDAFSELLDEQIAMPRGKGKEKALVPVFNAKGRIVDFTVQMSLAKKDQYLKVNNDIFEVVAENFGSAVDKVHTGEINTEGVDTLVKRKEEHFDGNEHEFVDIMQADWIDETFVRLPYEARQKIQKIADQGDGRFMVEEAYVDAMFGYRNWSIGEMLPVNDSIKRKIKIVEEGINGIVGIVNNNIVIKTPAVWGFNFASNFMTSAMSGMSPVQIIRSWREGLKELTAIQKDMEALAQFDNRARVDTVWGKKNAQRRAGLVGRINRNPTKELVDAGLYSAITTQEMHTDEFSYKNQFVAGLNKMVEDKPGAKKLTSIVKAAYLAEDTIAYKSLLGMVQVSDFLGRYGLYNHMVEQGKNKDEAYQYIQDVFVDFAPPVGKFFQYANSMGLILFYKYFIRIQRPIFGMMKHHPSKTMAMLGMRALTGVSPTTIFDSGIITGGNFAPMFGWLAPGNMLEQLIVPSGVEFGIDVLGKIGFEGGVASAAIAAGATKGIMEIEKRDKAERNR